ncbi:prepilin-type N-terminal cleavage/methylation domain-containing protein [Pedobacter hiemivivus]|uniref:Prepilin-type N-terminal cleavage/methylation domain-containing protein n=1 Tax=Pedobacter hiemivivus TaxID=2530454 RepID=A0A4V2MKC4_9SPHI|nr:prepilin-type N-terminal cleavage/methylation domain-containing protein [Pedobacter hiemivivus]TCC97686.1 hypothetical protein EZ444_07150 [Pedobacter hiemivivus]
MNLNKKVPAFTLMEVTIAMLIAGIAIAITFTAYRIVSGSYIGFSKKQDELAGFVLVDKLLKQDFLGARHIVKSSDGLAMEMEGGLISYRLDSGFMLRDQFSLRTDTFKLQLNSPAFLFESNVAEEGQPIDQFSFETVVQGQSIPLHYQKIYSAQDLFK